MNNSISEYLRAQEVAQLLGVSKRTVANWQRRRLLPHFKLGRVVLFRRSEIEAALEKFKIQSISIGPRRN